MATLPSHTKVVARVSQIHDFRRLCKERSELKNEASLIYDQTPPKDIGWTLTVEMFYYATRHSVKPKI